MLSGAFNVSLRDKVEVLQVQREKCKVEFSMDGSVWTAGEDEGEQGERLTR